MSIRHENENGFADIKIALKAQIDYNEKGIKTDWRVEREWPDVANFSVIKILLGIVADTNSLGSYELADRAVVSVM